MALREALKEWTRERVPLQWATTQNGLGITFFRLGERESGSATFRRGGGGLSRSAEGIHARAGAAAMGHDAKQSRPCACEARRARYGTANLEEAVAAYREALKEWTRERAPLQWAMTQNNLGLALETLGERESGAAKLEEAVAAYREALKEWNARAGAARVGGTQNNLGIAFSRLGEREEQAGDVSRKQSPPIARRSRGRCGSARQSNGRRRRTISQCARQARPAR